MTKKFLVADDSRVSRAKISSYIQDMGHEVVAQAVDGLDAIEKFKEFSPDFITMDIEMPNLNGIEAAKQILEINSMVNITLITSVVDKKLTLSALRFGVRNILQKPITFEDFAKEINSQMGGRS